MPTLLLLALLLLLPSCGAPSKRLWFPDPLRVTTTERIYDANRNGKPDFALRADDSGRLDILAYDDDEDGKDDRLYRLSNYRNEDVPHFIIMFDSIPFAAAETRFREGSWTWFDPPSRVIPPFPTLSGVIFSQLLGAPPLPGMINQYYTRVAAKTKDRLFERVGGDKNPWELRLDYRAKYWENGLMFLNPRPWFGAELARAKECLDDAPNRVCTVYFASTSGMLSQHGAKGLDECLDGLERLCVQVLYERRGAVKISALADHGHNLIAGKRIDIPQMLRDAGFTPSPKLKNYPDVVVELDGLVNYAGIHTTRPREAAAALVKHPEIELAIWQEGAKIIVQSARGMAYIEHRLEKTDRFFYISHPAPGQPAGYVQPAGDRYKYTFEGEDVFEYAPVINQLKAAAKADLEGFISAEDWFNATASSQWPDCPARLWHAFHGLAVNTPDLMVTVRDGHFAGLASMEFWIDMASTHGGLDQTHSATFLLTMTGRGKPAMRTREVMKTIEPTFTGNATKKE